MRSCERIEIIADDVLRCVPLGGLDPTEYNNVLRVRLESNLWDYEHTIYTGFYYALGLWTLVIHSFKIIYLSCTEPIILNAHYGVAPGLSGSKAQWKNVYLPVYNAHLNYPAYAVEIAIEPYSFDLVDNPAPNQFNYFLALFVDTSNQRRIVYLGMLRQLILLFF